MLNEVLRLTKGDLSKFTEKDDSSQNEEVGSDDENCESDCKNTYNFRYNNT